MLIYCNTFNRLSFSLSSGECSAGSSSRGSTDDLAPMLGLRELAGSVREKILLDYNSYMAHFIMPESCSLTPSPCHSEPGSPVDTKRVSNLIILTRMYAFREIWKCKMKLCSFFCVQCDCLIVMWIGVTLILEARGKMTPVVEVSKAEFEAKTENDIFNIFLLTSGCLLLLCSLSFKVAI